MSYTPASRYPSNTTLTVFQWSRVDAPNPRLARPISTTSVTTLYFTDAPKDKNGAVITSGFLMGIKNASGFVETVYVPPAALSVDGLTATGVVRGIRPEGLDFTTGDSTFASTFDADSPVFCNVAQVYHRMMIAALNGTIASGGNNWYIGDGTDSNITVYGFNADANKPFWRYDAATNQWVYSNDGVSSTPFGTGAGVTGGDGITVTAGDIDVDLTDTTTFRTSRSGNEARGVVTDASDGRIANNFLSTALGGGGAADALHYHSMQTAPIAAGEAVDGSSTPQLVYISDGTGGRTAGRFYKADADDTTNVAPLAIGFITENASSVGTTYNVKTGIVSGFTGLTAGAIYYASTTAGGITASPSAGANLYTQKPIAIAISTTALRVFPFQMTPKLYNAAATSMTIGSTTNYDVYTGWRAKSVKLDLYLTSDAGASADIAGSYNVVYDGLGWNGVVNSYVAGSSFLPSPVTSAPSLSTGSGNASSITVSVTVNANNTRISFANAIIAGSGSTGTAYNFVATIYPY